MANNPYAKFVAGDDPVAMLERHPRLISALAQEIGEEGLEKSYALGKWSGRFILAHLADCEVAFGFRWRQVAFTPGLAIQPFDQDAWAQNYSKLQAKWALGAFVTARLWNVEFLKSLPKEAFAHSGLHPERGELTLQDMIEITAGHDVNHMEQLEALVSRLV
jgi:hypothetical protein